MFKTFFLDTKKTIYILFAICFFSVIGAILIHLNPAGYFKIHTYPLFKWLNEHKRLDTFWIYLIIILFAHIALSSLYCLISDIKKGNYLIAIMHICVILFLLAHLISAIWAFRKTDNILIENIESIIFIEEHQKEIKLNLKKIDFEMNQFGMPVKLKGIINFNNDKTNIISVNNPIKIGDYHLIMKDLTSILWEIIISIEKNKEITKLSFKPNTSVKFDNAYLTLLNISEDLSTLKFKIEEGKNIHIKIVKIGEAININNQNFLLVNIEPSLKKAIIVDIVYDPSLLIIFVTSSIFTIALIAQFLVKTRIFKFIDKK